MITTVRMDDYTYLVEEKHWQELGQRTVCETARPDRRDRYYYADADHGYMMVVVQSPGGLVSLIGKPVLCLVQGFGGDNPAWTFGEFPGAPKHWRDGYIKVSIFKAERPEDQALAEGTLITTLDTIFLKALGPTVVLLRQHGLLPILQSEPDLPERAATWWQVLKRKLGTAK